MEVRTGTILGKRFEVRQDLGAGGFGQVWEGFDRDLKREMVIAPYRQTPAITKNTLPIEVGTFVLRLLEVDPANRFDSATQALSEFENVETAFKNLLQDRCLKLHDTLVSGGTPEAIDSNDLATGIALLKQAGFYPQARLLYDKGGLDLSQLSVATRNRVNEDYAFCVRRMEKKEVAA